MSGSRKLSQRVPRRWSSYMQRLHGDKFSVTAHTRLNYLAHSYQILRDKLPREGIFFIVLHWCLHGQSSGDCIGPYFTALTHHFWTGHHIGPRAWWPWPMRRFVLSWKTAVKFAQWRRLGLTTLYPIKEAFPVWRVVQYVCSSSSPVANTVTNNFAAKRSVYFTRCNASLSNA